MTRAEKKAAIAKLKAQMAEIEATPASDEKQSRFHQTEPIPQAQPESPRDSEADAFPAEALQPGFSGQDNSPVDEEAVEAKRRTIEEMGPVIKRDQKRKKRQEKKARKAEEKRMSAPDPMEARYEASLAEQAKEQEAEDAEAEMEAAKEKAKDALPSRDQAAKDRMLAGLKEGSPTALDNPAGEEPDVAFNPEMAEEMSGDPGDLEMQLFKTAHGGNFDPKSSMDRDKMKKLKSLLLSGQSFGDLTKEENQERFALKLYRQ